MFCIHYYPVLNKLISIMFQVEDKHLKYFNHVDVDVELKVSFPDFHHQGLTRSHVHH